MRQYLDILRRIMKTGVDRVGRNATTRALLAPQVRFDLRNGFPATTTKKLAFKSVLAELLWFIEGSTDVNRLKEIAGFDLKIWDGDARQHMDKGKARYEGDLGPVYGKQWRRWSAYRWVEEHADGHEWVPGTYEEFEIDQLKDVIERIKKNPYDRRLIVNAWNPAEIEDMALPACHMFFQFFVEPERGSSSQEPKYLSVHMNQRSCDMFLGVPFNIASYALLLSMVAQVTGLEPKECVITLVDAHIYHEHFAQVDEQLSREPFLLPSLSLNPEVRNIDDFGMRDAKLRNYNHHSPIKAPLITQDLKKEPNA